MVSLRKIFALALVIVALAAPVRAQSGLSPAQEAWLRSLFLNRTGVYDQAVINAASWTNYYKVHSNELASLFASGVTNLVPVYGTNFSASVTGHVGYVVFNTNLTNSGAVSNGATTLWTEDYFGNLTPNTNATVAVEMWWRVDGSGHLTPRN